MQKTKIELLVKSEDTIKFIELFKEFIQEPCANVIKLTYTNDILEIFFKDILKRYAGSMLPSKTFYIEYSEFCSRENIPIKNKNNISKVFVRFYPCKSKVKNIDGKSHRCFIIPINLI